MPRALTLPRLRREPARDVEPFDLWADLVIAGRQKARPSSPSTSSAPSSPASGFPRPAQAEAPRPWQAPGGSSSTNGAAAQGHAAARGAGAA